MGLVGEFRRDLRNLFSPTPVIPQEALPGPWLDEREPSSHEKLKAAKEVVPEKVQDEIKAHVVKILGFEGQLAALGKDVTKVDAKKALMAQMDSERKAILEGSKDERERQARMTIAKAQLDELKAERAKKT